MHKNRNSAMLVTWVLIVAFTIPASSCGAVESDSGDSQSERKIEWVAFDKGMELAKSEEKLLVVDFYTDWCHWCKVMDKETYGNEEVISFVKEKVVMAKVNPETAGDKFKFRDAHYSGRELSMMFGVTGFPTTVFINSKGELLTSVPGFIPAEEFVKILKYLAENWYEKMKYDEFVEKHAKDKG